MLDWAVWWSHRDGNPSLHPLLYHLLSPDDINEAEIRIKTPGEELLWHKKIKTSGE